MAGVISACASATSLLSTLEPLCGASVALNLAYLNLSKFGYITVVKDAIGGRLKKIDPNVKERIKDTEWFRQMAALSEVDTLDQSLPTTKAIWIKAPGIWGFFYNVLFYWRIGRGMAVVATLHALFLLMLGAGHQSNVTNWLACHFDDVHIPNDFALTCVGLLWPLFVVGIGQWVCSSASKFVKYQTSNLADEAKRDATEALDESTRAIRQSGTQFGPHQEPAGQERQERLARQARIEQRLRARRDHS